VVFRGCRCRQLTSSALSGSDRSGHSLGGERSRVTNRYPLTSINKLILVMVGLRRHVTLPDLGVIALASRSFAALGAG
jgi:hypothetical protein